MSVKLTTRESGNVMIVGISGKLTLGDATNSLREKIRELAAGGFRKVILDLAGVTYLDSSGLGELVAAYTTIARAGGDLKLLNIAKRGHDLLKITKLYTVFETFEDETSAIGSFPAGKPAVLEAQR